MKAEIREVTPAPPPKQVVITMTLEEAKLLRKELSTTSTVLCDCIVFGDLNIALASAGVPRA